MITLTVVVILAIVITLLIEEEEDRVQLPIDTMEVRLRNLVRNIIVIRLKQEINLVWVKNLYKKINNRILPIAIIIKVFLCFLNWYMNLLGIYICLIIKLNLYLRSSQILLMVMNIKTSKRFHKMNNIMKILLPVYFKTDHSNHLFII